MTYRSELVGILKPLLPTNWKFVTSERNIDDHNNAVVRLTQQAFSRHPSAPMSKLLVTFNLQIMAPGQDFERVEDDLDELVSMFLLTLKVLPSVVHWEGTATKVLSPENHLAYDIPLTITVTTPTPE